MGLARIGGATLGGLAIACTIEVDATVVGSGTTISELRTYESFDHIRVEDGLDVDVTLGAGPLVTLEGHDNLLVFVQTRVEGGRLVVEVEDGYDLQPAPKVDIKVPSLRFLGYRGGGRARVFDLVEDAVELSFTGAGSLEARGRVGSVIVRAVGSGTVDLRELLVEEIDIDAVGSGDVTVNARSRVDVRSVGSGDVVVWGGATVRERALGSGRIRRTE